MKEMKEMKKIPGQLVEAFQGALNAYPYAFKITNLNEEIQNTYRLVDGASISGDEKDKGVMVLEERKQEYQAYSDSYHYWDFAELFK